MILLIGYGNPLRRDDGAGPVLAGMLEERGGRNDLRVITVHQLAPELAQDLAAADVTAVLFLDASVIRCPEGEEVCIRTLDGLEPPPVFGHQFSPAELLCYAELLRGTVLPAWQVTIPGVDFGYGEGLSLTSEKNLASAFENLQVFLRKIPLQ
ncbi:MAG: hydrogenase maturation protease [Deltaproteobacteria bacterium]|nr:hydrogenase maturation protease [Deltaproteobacteria bacterium]TLN02414.1 MAG: hydrogenase maturation protease [bacterium]